MDIWKPVEESRTVEANKIKVVGDNNFPYLDMNMSFDENLDLSFGVNTRPGFQTGYLNVVGLHTKISRKQCLEV